MDLHILFGQRKEHYHGEFAPEALVCWDDATIDENPDGFENACEAARQKHQSEFVAFRVIPIRVDGDKIRQILTSTPVLRGTIVPETTG